MTHFLSPVIGLSQDHSLPDSLSRTQKVGQSSTVPRTNCSRRDKSLCPNNCVPTVLHGWHWAGPGRVMRFLWQDGCAMAVGDQLLALIGLTWAAAGLVFLSQVHLKRWEGACLSPGIMLSSRKRGKLLPTYIITQIHIISLMGAGKNGHNSGPILLISLSESKLFRIYLSTHTSHKIEAGRKLKRLFGLGQVWNWAV